MAHQQYFMYGKRVADVEPDRLFHFARTRKVLR
jgi:hypothetical protein